jgi:hypothetical protein
MATIDENINRNQITTEEIRDLSKETRVLVKTLDKVTESVQDVGKSLNQMAAVQLEMAYKMKAIDKDSLEAYKEKLGIQENIDDKQKDIIKGSTAFSIIAKKIKDSFNEISNIWEKILNRILDTFTVYKNLDQVVTDTRQKLGMLPYEGKFLFTQIRRTAIEMAHLGVTFENAKNSILEISSTFTNLVAQDNTLVKTTTMLNKSFGISNERSVKFLKTLAGISGTSATSQQNMAGFAQKITAVSGVPLDKLMEDVANASDDVRIFVGDSAVKMVKVAAEARMLGTSLSKAASTAKHFLNFESSINAELKASALLGRQINFNEARRMSFNKDTIGATKEILRLTKEVGFNQLNPIQQEAYAAAAGKSVTELQSMLQQEKNLERVRSYGSEKDIERLDNYERMLKLSEENAQNEGKIAKNEMLRLSNQTRINALTDQWNQFILELQEPILIAVEKLMYLAVEGMPLLINGIKGFSTAISGPVQLFTYIGIKIISISKTLKSLIAAALIFDNVFKTSFEVLSRIKPLMKILSFAKLIPGVGQIITGLIFINSLIKNISDPNLTAWEKFKNIIYDTILEPFHMIWKWAEEHIMGKSPSKLGLGIVKGISSIGSLLLDAIIQPFIMGYNWIQSSFIGKLLPGGTIEMSLLGLSSDSNETSASDSNKISASDSNKTSASDSNKTSASDSNKTSTSLNDIKVSNEVIAQKIDELITLMANGGISVNLDGTRVNESLDTSRFNRGNRGIASSIS